MDDPEKIEGPQKFNFPEIGDKNLAIFALSIIAVISMVFLQKEGLPIASGCVGAIGGLVVGDKKPK